MREDRLWRLLIAEVVVLCVLAMWTVSAQQQPIPPSVGQSIADKLKALAAELEAAMVPPLPPVDCVLSPWKEASVTSWAPAICPATGEQTRDELWTRTVTTQPANGGAACGPLQEPRTSKQSCTPPAPPVGTVKRLQQADLVYAGAFRVPAGFEWGGTALTYRASSHTLLMATMSERVGEFSIPAPSQAATIAALPRATLVQAPTDILQGKRTMIDGDTKNGVKLGGLLVLPSSLIVSAWSYYDAGPIIKQTKTHFVTGQNFAALTPASVTGPHQVGTGFQNIVPSDVMRIGGFVSGYMSTIPPQWQSALGGTHLTGQGGGISILVRTSSGPSASVFTPTQLGVTTPAPATIVLGYPSDTSNPNSPLNRPTLGVWGQNGGLYNGTQFFRGMVFPDGTGSLLFFGRTGTAFCYGTGTAQQALHLEPVPAFPTTHYCYDPVPGNVNNKGTHGYPYRGVVFAYDVDDLILVKKGQKKPWDLKPYATWTFSLPFQQRLVNGVDVGVYDIVGAAWDPATRHLFMSGFRNDGDSPVIYVFTLP